MKHLMFWVVITPILAGCYESRSSGDDDTEASSGDSDTDTGSGLSLDADVDENAGADTDINESCPEKLDEMCGDGEIEHYAKMIEAADLGKGMQFTSIFDGNGIWLTAYREVDTKTEIAVIEFEFREQKRLIASLEGPDASGLIPKGIDCGTREHPLVSCHLLLCSVDEQCSLWTFDISHQDEPQKLVRVPEGKVPEQGTMQGLKHIDYNTLCVFGDGIHCFRHDENTWDTLVVAGELPLFNAIDCFPDQLDKCKSLVAVGDQGNIVVAAAV